MLVDNHIAGVSYKVRDCGCCNGYGDLSGDFRQVYLKLVYRGVYMNYADMLNLARELRDYGTYSCPSCSGKGQVEVRY